MPLTEIQFPKHIDFPLLNKIYVAGPARDKGALTVICGKNHSGKTFILKRVHRIILNRNAALEANPDTPLERRAESDIYCNFSDSALIAPVILVTKISAITELNKGTSTAQEVNNKNMRHYKGQTDMHVRFIIKDCLADVTAEFLEAYFKRENGAFDPRKWAEPTETNYRLGILHGFSETQLAVAPGSNPIVRLFEKLTLGRLYFGISTPQKSLPLFEFHLVFNGGVSIPYGSWSEGQKVLMSLLLLVYYKRPAMLLFDEVENHLHPHYISAVLEFIKERVSQTIITTHHPHIIFSMHADAVNYLDLEKSEERFPDIIPYDKLSRNSAPKRTSQLLEKSYAKLISSYKLFDAYDNQLLRISSASLANLNEVLTSTFTTLFNYEIVSPANHTKPDLQSQKIYDLFRRKMTKGPIKVLEFGAGEGRLLVDVSKILRTGEKERIDWCLYEPIAEPRQKIEALLREYPYADQVTVSATPPEDKFDFIVIANVLHELTPDAIAEALNYCHQAIKDDGEVLIVELYPLLKPEQFAVPLSSHEWAQLGRKLGFKAFADHINFKYGNNEAYFLQLSKEKGAAPDTAEIRKRIVKFWNEQVLLNRSGDYAGQVRLGDSDEIPRTLGGLATIASITAYNCGNWK